MAGVHNTTPMAYKKEFRTATHIGQVTQSRRQSLAALTLDVVAAHTESVAVFESLKRKGKLIL